MADLKPVQTGSSLFRLAFQIWGILEIKALKEKITYIKYGYGEYQIRKSKNTQRKITYRKYGKYMCTYNIDMNKSELLNLTKDQLIDIMMNLRPVPEYQQKTLNRKIKFAPLFNNLKQMVQAYVENIIETPIEFRDYYKPE